MTALESPDLPLVSVVVPTRERPVLLRRALRSILEQDYAGRLECLVVFDQSDVQELAGTRVGPGRALLRLANTRTPGLAGARNSGILAASGELVAFCDDDDEWSPTKLSRQVETLRAHPGRPVVSCGIVTVAHGRERTRVLQRHEVPHEAFLRSRVMEVHSSTLLFRRAALLGPVGLVDEAIPGSYSEDYELLLRASRQAPVLITPHPLVRVHFDEGSYFLRQWQLMVDSSQYLLVRHPGIAQDARGLARIHGRISVAHAALGNRASALTHAARSIRLDPLRLRPWFAVALTARLISVDQASRLADLLRSRGPARSAAHVAWDRLRGRLERAAGVAGRPARLLGRVGATAPGTQAVGAAPAHVDGAGSGRTGLHVAERPRTGVARATPRSGGRSPGDHEPASSCAGRACGCAQPGARQCGPAA